MKSFDSASIKYRNRQQARRNAQKSLKIMALKEDEVAYAPIDSSEIGNAVAKIVKDYEDEKLQFQIEVSSPIDFLTDKALLIAMIKSLVDNAVKYADYRKDSPRVRIKINQAVDKELRIQIEDNGVGIDPTIEGKVFDLFFRGNERSKGPGLGLFIAKKAVEKLEGTICFSSESIVLTRFFYPTSPAIK